VLQYVIQCYQTHRHSDTEDSQSFDLDQVDNPPYLLGRWNQLHGKEEVEVAVRV
jgi:hypothetical protein